MILNFTNKINKLTQPPWPTIKPHENILKIPFLYRKLLSKKFNDVLGLHYIDHISIEIINPELEWVSFSSTPSMLHNLITTNLWQFDGSLSPQFYEKLSFYSWEETYYKNEYSRLKKLKEHSFPFQYGFCLIRKIDQFFFIYSFATKSLLSTHYEFYETKYNDLLKIGDFYQKQLRNIYHENSSSYSLPLILEFIPYNSIANSQAALSKEEKTNIVKFMLTHKDRI